MLAQQDVAVEWQTAKWYCTEQGFPLLSELYATFQSDLGQ